MALWLLEAKAFPEDDRAAAAREVKFWLKPGTYSVGRTAGQVDLDVVDDKSISRKHAEIVVPALHDIPDGDTPYVLLKDCSRYGTQAAAGNELTNHEIKEARVFDRWYIKFGYKSPFRLYLLDYRLYFPPPPSQAAAAAHSLAATKAAAAAAGLRVTTQLGQPNTLVVSLAPRMEVGGDVLLALLRGHTAVQAGWVLRWGQQRVWRNVRPQEGEYPVTLAYQDPSGEMKAVEAGWAGLACMLAGLQQRRVLEGRTFVWPGGHRDEALEAVVEQLGGRNQAAPGSPSDAPVPAAQGFVVVRPSEGEAARAPVAHLPWVTPQLLVSSIVEGGSLEGGIRPGDAHTPPITSPKGRKRKAAAKTTPTSPPSTKGRRRTRAQVAGDGSDTDVTADSQPPRSRQRLVLPLDDEVETPLGAASLPAPFQAPAAAQQKMTPAGGSGGGRQQERAGAKRGGEEAGGASCEGEAEEEQRVPVKVLASSAMRVGGGARKRKAAVADVAAQQAQQEDDEAACAGAAAGLPASGGKGRQRKKEAAGVAAAPAEDAAAAQHASRPAKRRKAAGATVAAAAGQGTAGGNGSHAKQSEQAAAVAAVGGFVLVGDKENATTPAAPAAAAPREPVGDGWHQKVAKQEGLREGPTQPHASQAQQTQRSRAKAAAAMPPPAALPSGTAGGREHAQAQAAAEGRGGIAAGNGGKQAQQDSDGEEEVEGDGDGQVTVYEPLVMAVAEPPRRAAQPIQGGPNFKAFRRAGGAPQLACAIPFDPQPYQEERIDADAFLRSETDRRKRTAAADELFAANIKARKAAPLPTADEEQAAPAAGKGGRGRGRGAKAPAAEASQPSMLSFLPATKGRGRGRGRGKG